MQDLITSFLVQTKECSLPRIGKFSIESTSVEMDNVNKKAFPPSEKLVFSGRPDQHTEELVKYISYKKNSSEIESAEKLKRWCEETKEKINQGEKITFTSIGSLQKNTSGTISFEPENNFRFFEAVNAERVIHKNEEHAVLVGDRETTSSVMNQFLNEEEIVKNSRWKIAAIILFAIAVIVLFIHFYIHSFSFFSTGNENQFTPATPAATYSQQ